MDVETEAQRLIEYGIQMYYAGRKDTLEDITKLTKLGSDYDQETTWALSSIKNYAKEGLKYIDERIEEN